MGIKHRYTLFADELRREDNGKFLVMGMYAGSVGVPQIPFVIPSFTIVQFFEADTPGQYSVKTRLEHSETGHRLFDVQGSVGVGQPGPVVAPLQVRNFKFDRYGTYNVVIEIEGEEPSFSSFSVAIMQPPQPQVPLRR